MGFAGFSGALDKTAFEGTTVGGLSALVFDRKRKVCRGLADDEGRTAARLYTPTSRWSAPTSTRRTFRTWRPSATPLGSRSSGRTSTGKRSCAPGGPRRDPAAVVAETGDEGSRPERGRPPGEAGGARLALDPRSGYNLSPGALRRHRPRRPVLAAVRHSRESAPAGRRPAAGDRRHNVPFSAERNPIRPEDGTNGKRGKGHRLEVRPVRWSLRSAYG